MVHSRGGVVGWVGEFGRRWWVMMIDGCGGLVWLGRSVAIDGRGPGGRELRGDGRPEARLLRAVRGRAGERGGAERGRRRGRRRLLAGPCGEEAAAVVRPGQVAGAQLRGGEQAGA